MALILCINVTILAVDSARESTVKGQLSRRATFFGKTLQMFFSL